MNHIIAMLLLASCVTIHKQIFSTQAGAHEPDSYTKMSCGGDSFPEQ